MDTTNSKSRANLFSRILEADRQQDSDGKNALPPKSSIMITKVTVRPNPFYTVLTLDVTCSNNRNIIVRMFNEAGKIVKMFSWYLVKGTNVTAINDMNNLAKGEFVLDIIDNEGKVLFTTNLTKE